MLITYTNLRIKLYHIQDDFNFSTKLFEYNGRYTPPPNSQRHY
jgi:hypothetical protein